MFSLTLVDGGWSEWSEWTECSRTCGGGYRSKSRMCDDPPGTCGGNKCEGMPNITEICNGQCCKSKYDLNF